MGDNTEKQNPMLTDKQVIEQQASRILELTTEREKYMLMAMKNGIQGTAPAAIVKQLREALIGVLSLDEEHQRGADDIDVCYEVRRGREALAIDTTTAENVLAEYRREVVAECAKVAEAETNLSRVSLSNILGDDGVSHCHVAKAIRALIAAPKENSNEPNKL